MNFTLDIIRMDDNPLPQKPSCPACLCQMSGALGVTNGAEAARLTPGSPVVCGACGALLVATEHGFLRRARAEEIRSWPRKARAMIQELSTRFAARRNR